MLPWSVSTPLSVLKRASSPKLPTSAAIPRSMLRCSWLPRLVSSLIGYVAVFFLIFSILGMVGVDTKVLLASAGVVSIAVGMGSQSMASDLLAGFFMMLEGSIHVGDQVTVGGSRETATGKVVDMGVRTIKILEETGNLVTMNNSKATPIKNLSQGRELPESEDKPEDKPEKKQENGSQKAD